MATADDILAARIREALHAAGIDPSDAKHRAALVQVVASGGTVPRKISAADKQVQCLELRRAGASFDQIAEVVGYANRGSAYRATMTALQKLVTEGAEELRNLELSRLDALMAGGVYSKALRGDEKAIDRVLKIMAERRRYVPDLEVPAPRHPEDGGGAGGFGGGPIVVELSIPDPDPTPPVPEHELTAIDVTSTPVLPPANPHGS